MVISKKIRIHILNQLILLTVLTSGIIYPFLSGEYDRLAMSLSILIQGIGIAGLLLSATGIFWLTIPGKFRFFANSSVYIASFLTIVFAFFAHLMAGLLFGVIILACCALIIIRLRQRLKNTTDKQSFSFVPVYLVVIPLSLLIIQLLIAKPVTDWSRRRTIANADEYIRDIENFQSKNGYYPKTLQAMYQDYFPQTVGVEKYHYLPYGNSYNISFEQPGFFLDLIGTKEWVVYNPKDEHRVYSHTSWFLLLSPEESELRQGWYTSENTEFKHWKSFFFD
ncbi:MAG: hypothetical protein AB9834_05670 [Lentimicrobium sp.]